MRTAHARAWLIGTALALTAGITVLGLGLGLGLGTEPSGPVPVPAPSRSARVAITEAPVRQIYRFREQSGGPADRGRQVTVQFPFAQLIHGRGGPVILLSFNRNRDSLAAREVMTTLRSTDLGRSWRSVPAAVPMNSVYRDRDGIVEAIDTRTMPTASVTRRAVRYWTSRDDGVSWSVREGDLRADFPLSSAIFHRSVITARDGGRLATVYGRREATGQNEVWLAASRDGRRWRITATVAGSSAGSLEGADEPSLVRLTDGELLVVYRRWAPGNPAVCRGRFEGSPLAMARSLDDGGTWQTEPFLASAGTPVRETADPDLVVSPEDGLVLSSGRPRTSVFVSSDGLGRSWNLARLTDDGITSGYTSLVPLGGHRYLQFGDDGSNWCFPTGAEDVGIWSRVITVVGGSRP